MPNTLSDAGKAHIKAFESCAQKLADGRYRAYPDPATHGAPWTIGWGTTGAGITQGTIWTQAQCDAALDHHLQQLAAALNSALEGAPTSQGQFDGLMGLAYNIGLGALSKSRLFALHKEGRCAAAALHFASFNQAGGKVMAGLVRRRAAERALYEGPGA